MTHPHGDCYAWGETKTKSSYDEDNSEACGNWIGDIRGTSRDVAYVKWGGTWRMPTKAEFQEMKENCDYEWTTQNGVKGGKFTSRKNGNSIFLPAAGWRNGTSLDYTGSFGNYWSSTPDEGKSQYAFYLYFSKGYRDMSQNYRYYGLSVRPVAE